MVEVDITEEMIAAAKQRAEAMGAIKNSLTKGDGNLSGFIGEEMVLKLFPSFSAHSTKDFDLIYNDGSENLKIEVKTKRRTVEPKDFYTCHIAKTSTHQDPDVYFFCQVNMKTEPYRGWVLGWLPKNVFYDRAEYRSKGQLDERGFAEKTNSFVCKISDLYAVEIF
jgi:hypothetical protein